ncbi:hypothetical protein FISHEDRAFT_55773 [Fistulina hepatica ATCC 64428]|uniref:Uncharacterized protein n=1 Tax=Fistulina hepatica ATCC 64428 TaxID=1128425 RepID=A0A0D7APU6_9AGAR|nr:hypothetical protein FISHEDRAFT_55773 [Fistulina hepatica ATCC 64428]
MPTSLSPPPVPPSELAVALHVDALDAALLKLGITNVSATTLLDTAKQKSVSKQKLPHTTAERCKGLVKLASLPDDTTLGSVPPYKSVFRKDGAACALSHKRPFRMVKCPISDPYTSVWINEYGGAVRDLPCVPATIIVTPLDDDSADPPEQRFENVWCLWDDTGVQVSCILSNQLEPPIWGGQTSGQAIMSIK